MAVQLCTLTGNIGDIAGAPVAARSGSNTIRNARIETNVPEGEFVVAGDQIRLGSRPIVINADGTFTEQGLLRSDSTDINVETGTLLYRVTFDARGTSYSSTWFALTTATASLATVVDAQNLPLSYVTQATRDFQDLADGEVQRAAAEADRAAAEADRARSVAEIEVPDDVMAAVASDPTSDFYAVQTATYVVANPTSESVVRDAGGLIVEETVNGLTTTYTRDGLGRVATFRVGDGPTRTVLRDGAGRRIGVS